MKRRAESGERRAAVAGKTAKLDVLVAKSRARVAARAAEQREAEALRASEWRRRFLEADADRVRLQAEKAAILNVSEADLAPVRIEAPRAQPGGDATALLALSDLHVFERVRKAEVNGLNEHNAAIASAGIKLLFQKALRLVQIERSATNVRTFVLALLGDLMTNQLHEDQLETNEGTPQEEILFLLEHLAGGIELLLREGEFERIVVPCCDGNHGRDTEKMRAANRVKHSHEWLLYCLLARHFAAEPRVQFSIADGTLHYMELYGRTIRLTHGEAIRYQGGVGGLTIPARKAIAEWDRGRRADLTVFGHWHTSLLDKQFLSNGSALGYSPYSVRIKAPFELPQQAFVVFDAKRWISAFRPIYLR